MALIVWLIYRRKEFGYSASITRANQYVSWHMIFGLWSVHSVGTAWPELEKIILIIMQYNIKKSIDNKQRILQRDHRIVEKNLWNRSWRIFDIASIWMLKLQRYSLPRLCHQTACKSYPAKRWVHHPFPAAAAEYSIGLSRIAGKLWWR